MRFLAAGTSGCRSSILRATPLVLLGALVTNSVMAEEAATPLHAAPLVPVPPLFTKEKIDSAVAALDGIVRDAMTRTGVPGIAVGVIYKDEVIYAKGFGVRHVGKPETIDADTVFQLASVSKPISSTIVAKLVGDGIVKWEDRAKSHNPDFALRDPYVTKNATIADLLSHRSGLHTGAGDLLEDLGFDRDYILSHLDQQPLDPFRSSYNYSNYGYTEGGIAAAKAARKGWEELAEEALFEPAGMNSVSYRHADFIANKDRAFIHKRLADGKWAALYDRNPDAEAPAGGASGSLNDMLRFLRLQLGNGILDGKQIVHAGALMPAHIPQMISGSPRVPAARTPLYGFGWNVSYDDEGRTRIGHSGAFDLGAATFINFMPGEDIGIAVLTNGQPIGVPEAIGAAFFDVAQNGKPTVDWVAFMGAVFKHIYAENAPTFDYSKVPSQPKPARDLESYTGRYENDYYGPVVVSKSGKGLAMVMGPAAAPKNFALNHFDGDTFSFETIGENANGLAGAIFEVKQDGKASTVRLDFYDRTGLGTFTKK